MSWITRPSGRMLALRITGSSMGSSRIFCATVFQSSVLAAATDFR